MNKQDIRAVLGSPIAFHAEFARRFGGIEAGLFLSQMTRWQEEASDTGGWVHKTQAEIEEETGLTRYSQETVRRKLRDAGALEEKRKGAPPKLYFRIILDEIF